MSGLLFGALGGLGQGLVNQSERNWKDEVLNAQNQHDFDMEAMRRQADMEREKRIEEAQIRREGREAVNRKQQQQDDLAFQTDPKNVGLLTQAALTKQRALDEYGDSRSDIEIQQAAKKAAALDRATYHDHTDYAGRSLAHEEAMLRIDMLRNAPKPRKMDEIDEKNYDSINRRIEQLDKAKSELMPDDVLRADEIDTQITALEGKKAAIVEKYSDAMPQDDGGNKDNDNQGDPLGLRQERREAMIQEIKKLNPTANLNENLSNQDLRTILEMEREAATKKKTPAKPPEEEAPSRVVTGVNDALSRARLGLLRR